MKVGIIGLGLIGGSMAIDLKRRGFADEIYGVEADSVNAAAAEKIGLVDRVLTLEECVKESDLRKDVAGNSGHVQGGGNGFRIVQENSHRCLFD